MTARYSTAEFDYDCPKELIAQHPLADRAESRLLVLDRDSGAITHRRFRDFPELLSPGDVLVRNASRVIPARLTGRRENGREAEILLVHDQPDGSWLAMVHPGGKLKVGRRVWFGDDAVAEIVDVLGGGLRQVRFTGIDARGVMERHGTVPLPPYIDRPAAAEDRERYQTVYARENGSVAAPTAGLHFTSEIFREIAAKGVRIVDVLLHVGPGTFKPVETDDPAEHAMHAEWYEIPPASAEAVNVAKHGGQRVWAVGTTVARVLETAVRQVPGQGIDSSAAAAVRAIRAGNGWTKLFIYPPFVFGVVDALLTNFHLPRSTLIMLVAAFAGYEHAMQAYRVAVEQRYRLFSYGDAMAIM